jgi:hypothetical protein
MSSIAGSDTCGLADDLEIPDARSLERLDSWPGGPMARADQRASSSTRPSPWYRVPRETIGVYLRGDWRHRRLIVTWGRSDGDRVRELATGLADLERAQVGAIPANRWFVAEPSFPGRPAGADVVRITPASAQSTSTARVSAPVSYAPAGVDDLLVSRDLTTLSSPYLFEARPCATLPRLELGVAEPPDLLLDRGPPPLTNVTSPFIGLTDIYTVWKAPLESEAGSGSFYVWGTVTAYWVTKDPRDAVAPAMRRRVE